MAPQGKLRLDRRAFRSRVARRIFLVFVACALAPVTAFAIFSFVQVSDQLETDARAQLRADSKAAGMSLLDRLTLLEGVLRNVDAGESRGFLGVHQLDELAAQSELPPRTTKERERLDQGGVILRVVVSGDETALFLVRAAGAGWVAGEIDPAYLWRPDALRRSVELGVRDVEGRFLFASTSDLETSLSDGSGDRVDLDGSAYLRESWTLFLDSNYLAPSWEIVHLRAEADVFEPLREFRFVYPLIAVLAIWVVVFVSVGQIRRSLVPIELLQEATDKLAEGDFDARVAIESDDEFRDLGNAFNDMGARLGDLTRNLESKVEARTAELRDALDELRATQAQLVHHEKMASVGQFVAGIAHELNNPLSFIEGNFHFLRHYVQSAVDALERYQELAASCDSELADRFEKVRTDLGIEPMLEDLESVFEGCADGVQRTTTLVKDLRVFSRVDDGEVVPADLNEGIASTVNLLRGELAGREVNLELGDLPLVPCLASQLNQVFMNLLSNAAQATPEGGMITVRSEVVDESVVVEVLDTGSGMDPETVQKVFEPFFTTKPVGEGTGLGLSVSYGIVERHGGSLEVSSALGEGSCFCLKIPTTFEGQEARA